MYIAILSDLRRQQLLEEAREQRIGRLVGMAARCREACAERTAGLADRARAALGLRRTSPAC